MKVLSFVRNVRTFEMTPKLDYFHAGITSTRLHRSPFYEKVYRRGSAALYCASVLWFATKMVPSQTRRAPASDVCTCGLTRGSADQ